MKKHYKVFVAAVCLVILILDSKTTILGAKEGIYLCMNSVIPSLLPMLIISIYITSRLHTLNLSFLAPLAVKLGIPKGFEGLLPVSYLSGYPIGAQTVAQAYKNGQLSKESAEKLLSFCNNAGPSFVFGVNAVLFQNSTYIWLLWVIHIFSSLTTGLILSSKTETKHIKSSANPPFSIQQSLRSGIQALTQICAWVILFRVMISLLDRWIFWILPPVVRVIFVGILELANGCMETINIADESTRFIISSFFLALGGICVTMQTISVTSPLSIKNYLKGKILHCSLSVIFSYVTLLFIIPGVQMTIRPELLLPFPCLVAAHIGFSKKRVAKKNKVLYNV